MANKKINSDLEVSGEISTSGQISSSSNGSFQGNLVVEDEISLNDDNRINFDKDGDGFAWIKADILNAEGFGTGATLYAADNSHHFINGEDFSYAPVTASEFITNGGTSSQFLKADGSIDTSTYITDNIYTSDGSISANRTIDIDEHALSFLNDNDVKVVIQSKTETSEDDGNINIYSANGVKQLDIDAEYDDALSGDKGTYFAMYNGINGAVGLKQRIHTNNGFNEWKLYEYDTGNFGPITDPTSEPTSVIQMRGENGGTNGISLDHSTARFTIGAGLTAEPTYRFYNASNSLFKGDIDIIDGVIDITQTADNKRFEMLNPARVKMYTAADAVNKSIDIDGDDSGGGFIGVYSSNATSPDRGVVMHSAPDNDINFLRVYQLNSGTTVAIDLKSELVGGVPVNSAIVNGHITGERLILNDSSSTGSPFMSFEQDGTRRSLIQHVDSGDMLSLVSEYGGIRMMTGTVGAEVNRFQINNTGRVMFARQGITGSMTASIYDVNITGDDFSDKYLNFWSQDGTNFPRAWLKHSSSATAQELEFNGTFATGSGYADFAFRRGATPIMFLDQSNQHVGIGTESPASRLHTYSATGNVTATFESGDADSWISIKDNASGTYGVLLGATGDDFIIAPNNSEKMRITSAGNVGIGANSPGALLQVGDTETDAELIRLSSAYVAGRVARGGINWHNGTDTTGRIYTEYDGTMVSMVFGSLYNSGYNSNDLMVIRGNGNVGIGTTSPSERLHIADTSATTVLIEDTDTSKASNANLNFKAAGVEVVKMEAILGAANAATGGGLSISTATNNSGGYNNSILTLTNDNRVGVGGLPSPKATLEVNGGVKIGDDTDTANSDKPGTLRYRTSGNNSYVDMCMQTGASTYAWINIQTNSW